MDDSSARCDINQNHYAAIVLHQFCRERIAVSGGGHLFCTTCHFHFHFEREGKIIDMRVEDMRVERPAQDDID